MNYENSNALLKRALKVTPLGAQTFSKSYRYYCEGSAPLFAATGEGSHIIDVDGNEFIDFVGALGPITIGYNNQEINSAVIEQINKGMIFSIQTEKEVQLAEKICEVIPCAQMVRFVKNGSDATTAAVRLARAFTGREIILMCGYHGMHDWSIGASANNKGVPMTVRELTKTFVYNDIDSVKKLFADNKGKVAAVILEPIQANGPKDNFLKDLKELTAENDSLLIFDEVVSGFRYALGGASEIYKVIPDLSSFGKGMGNGLPISAVAGREDIMQLIETGVFVSTTFGGDAMSMAGALKAIEILSREGAYKHIWRVGNKLLDGLRNLAQKYKVDDVVIVSGLAPHGGVQFEGKNDLNYLDINSVYTKVMTDNHILQVGLTNICLSHSDQDIDRYLAAAEKAIVAVKQSVASNSVEEFVGKSRVNPVFKRNIK